MALTGKQKRAIKAAGQTLGDDLHLGKAGLSEGFLAMLNQLLNRKELVKLRFGEVEGGDRKALAAEVAGAVGAELVQVLGRTMLLYRANPELDAEKRVLRD